MSNGAVESKSQTIRSSPSPHAIKPQHPSNSPRPYVPRPPKTTQQSAAASSPNTINSQNSMSNGAVESKSQTIRSSPSTPLPLNSPGSPSSSTTSSSSPLQTINSATASPTVGSNQTPPQTTDRILTLPKGNFSTSAFTLPSTASTLSGSVPFIFNSSTTASIAFPSTISTGAIPTSEPLVNNSETAALTSTLATSPRSYAASSSNEPFIVSSLESASSTSLVTSTQGGGGDRPTITGTGQSSASNTAAAGAGSSGNNGPPTSTVVGGVVGGVCGAALLIFLLLLFLRLRRKGVLRRTISPPIPQTSAPSGATAEGGTMTERSSAAIPLAAAGFWRSLRPRSGQTATTTETAPSERGFQNLGGRKLESVLSTRGDGYGDLPFGAAGTSGGPGPTPNRGQAPPAIPIVTAAPGAVPGHSSPESLSGSSFYRDSHGFYGGPQAEQDSSEPPSNNTSMYVGPGSRPTSLGVSQDIGPPPMGEGVAVMRPGPARTPVTSQGGFSPMRGSSRTPRGTAAPHVPGTVPEDLPPPRDGVGRSHPSLDGSRGSRFHEDV
ncbi:MAG: hypothetical protein Q9214_003792 [Letrouitia sp. 1 TL-2023]